MVAQGQSALQDGLDILVDVRDRILAEHLQVQEAPNEVLLEKALLALERAQARAQHADEERRRCLEASRSLRGSVRVMARVRPPLSSEEDCGQCLRVLSRTQLEVLVEPRALLTEQPGRSRRRSTGITWEGSNGSRSTSVLSEGARTQLENSTSSSTSGLPPAPPSSGPGVRNGLESRTFFFDQIFDADVSDDDVFTAMLDELSAAVDGEAVCILAYGATGSGKTHTVMNLAERTAKELERQAMCLERGGLRLEITVQIVEIYNEQLRDLLAQDITGTEPPRLKLSVSNSSPALQGATCQTISSNSSHGIAQSLEEALQVGQAQRATSSTAVHGRSSRSHLVMTLLLTTRDAVSGTMQRTGKFSLVDLAGSERIKRSEAVGERLREAQHINKSLSALADVIWAKERRVGHVPYRNSKLTHLLQDSLGGQALCRTVVIVALPPTRTSVSETFHSLQFSQRLNSLSLQTSRRTLHESGLLRDDATLEAERLREENAQIRAQLDEKDRVIQERDRQLEERDRQIEAQRQMILKASQQRSSSEPSRSRSDKDFRSEKDYKSVAMQCRGAKQEEPEPPTDALVIDPELDFKETDRSAESFCYTVPPGDLAAGEPSLEGHWGPSRWDGKLSARRTWAPGMVGRNGSRGAKPHRRGPGMRTSRSAREVLPLRTSSPNSASASSVDPLSVMGAPPPRSDAHSAVHLRGDSQRQASSSDVSTYSSGASSKASSPGISNASTKLPRDLRVDFFFKDPDARTGIPTPARAQFMGQEQPDAAAGGVLAPSSPPWRPSSPPGMKRDDSRGASSSPGRGSSGSPRRLSNASAVLREALGGGPPYLSDQNSPDLGSFHLSLVHLGAVEEHPVAGDHEVIENGKSSHTSPASPHRQSYVLANFLDPSEARSLSPPLKLATPLSPLSLRNADRLAPQPTRGYPSSPVGRDATRGSRGQPSMSGRPEAVAELIRDCNLGSPPSRPVTSATTPSGASCMSPGPAGMSGEDMTPRIETRPPVVNSKWHNRAGVSLVQALVGQTGSPGRMAASNAVPARAAKLEAEVNAAVDMLRSSQDEFLSSMPIAAHQGLRGSAPPPPAASAAIGRGPIQAHLGNPAGSAPLQTPRSPVLSGSDIWHGQSDDSGSFEWLSARDRGQVAAAALRDAARRDGAVASTAGSPRDSLIAVDRRIESHTSPSGGVALSVFSQPRRDRAWRDPARSRSGSSRGRKGSPREYIVEVITPQRARELTKGNLPPPLDSPPAPQSPALLLCPGHQEAGYYDQISSVARSDSSISLSSDEGDIKNRLHEALQLERKEGLEGNSLTSSQETPQVGSVPTVSGSSKSASVECPSSRRKGSAEVVSGGPTVAPASPRAGNGAAAVPAAMASASTAAAAAAWAPVSLAPMPMFSGGRPPGRPAAVSPGRGSANSSPSPKLHQAEAATRAPLAAQPVQATSYVGHHAAVAFTAPWPPQLSNASVPVSPQFSKAVGSPATVPQLTTPPLSARGPSFSCSPRLIHGNSSGIASVSGTCRTSVTSPTSSSCGPPHTPRRTQTPDWTRQHAPQFTASMTLSRAPLGASTAAVARHGIRSVSG